jgi:DNA-binding CsgD family transcriptional regulator
MVLADPEAELSALIADIYDAALDPQLWPVVLPKASHYAGGQAAALLSKSGPAGATVFYYHGVTPHYMQSYLDQYYRYDTFGVIEAMGHPLCEAITTVDLMPYEEFAQGRFYREWAAPQGWVDSAWALLDRSPKSFAFFSILRNAGSGLVDAGTRRRMSLIAPHLRRAVLIGNVIGLAQGQAASFADVLDCLRAAVFFVDAFGRVEHANLAARAMLDKGDPFRLANGQLQAVDTGVEPALLAAFAAAAGGDAAIGGDALALPLGGAIRRVAHVLPLTARGRLGAGQGSAVAALFVHEQELAPPQAPELIARTYRLTPTELRVLLAVVDVGGVPDVAAALGIAETTVRTHLGRVYDKTELNRQADLVKLVAGFSSPLDR